MTDRTPGLTEQDERRLLAKIGLPDSSGCMPWLAGTDAYGYGQLSLHRDGAQYARKAHRLVHELLVGPIPHGADIDHVCGRRDCCAPAHLRAVSRKQNMENLGGAYRTSKSGIRGVSWHKPRRKWTARVQHNHKSIYLGLYEDIDEAAAAVAAARDDLYTHNDRDRAQRAEA